MGMKIHTTYKPNYNLIKQNDDVITNKRIVRLSKRYPDKKFSDLLDNIRGIAVEHIIENM